jgi:hypothetical protein
VEQAQAIIHDLEGQLAARTIQLAEATEKLNDSQKSIRLLGGLTVTAIMAFALTEKDMQITLEGMQRARKEMLKFIRETDDPELLARLHATDDDEEEEEEITASGTG